MKKGRKAAIITTTVIVAVLAVTGFIINRIGSSSDHQAASSEASIFSGLDFEVLQGVPDISGLDYEISYQVLGEGGIAAADGMFLLELRHTGDHLICNTANGEKSLALGDGDYRLSVRSGVLELTRNGHFEGSYLLPLSEKQNPSVKTHGLLDVNVRVPEQRDIYFCGNGEIDYSAQNVSQLWSLEFEKDGTGDEYIELSDGSYLLRMYMSESVIAYNAPLGGTGGQSERLCEAPQGRHLYRVTSIKGIACLYIDNEWAGSMRLPTSEIAPKLQRTFASDDAVTIWRSEADEWTFCEDFDDKNSICPEEYWLGTEDMAFVSDESGSRLLVSDGTALLNGFLKDLDVSARMKITSGKGTVGIVSRYSTDYIKLFVGYDYGTGMWVIRQVYGTEIRTYAKAKGDVADGEWLDMVLKLDGKKMSLSVNGEEVIAADNVDYSVHGRVGIFAEGGGAVEVDKICVSGDGRIVAGIHEQSYMRISASSFVEMKDGSVLMVYEEGNRSAMRSTDQGYTFVEDSLTGLSKNTIRLQNGEILTIRWTAGEKKNTYWDDAYITSDEGETYSGPYRLNTIERNRITMQDKLMQTRTGRIIFCGGETGHGNETYGRIGIYYSDDNGRTWSESQTSIDIFTTGVNVQEGCVTDLPDGTLRCYMRTDRGFIYFTDSTDGGKTWDLDLKKTALPAPMCAFNVMRDPWEEETYYMIWEYDNKNVDPFQAYPRTRVALAVSYDGCENWEYAADLSAFDMYVKGSYKMSMHMNLGIRVFKDYILADACVTEAGNREYVWRIDKEKIRTQKRFPVPYLIK